MATACDLPLLPIENDACLAQAYQYGQQIRTIFYQDMSGDAPDLLGTKTTPATLATFQAALSAAAPDKLFVLKDLAGGVVAAATDTLISGNDVPGGGSKLATRTNTYTGFTDLVTPELVTSINAMIRRGGEYRLWFADDKGYVQGYADGATIVFGTLERAGINNATNRISLTVTFLRKEIMPLGYAPVVGVNALTNV
jgi:hypothetical protein